MKEAQRCTLQQMSLLKQGLGLAARRDLKLRKQKKVSLLVSSGDCSQQILTLLDSDGSGTSLICLVSRGAGCSEVPVPISALLLTCSVTWHKSLHCPASVSLFVVPAENKSVLVHGKSAMLARPHDFSKHIQWELSQLLSP